MKMPPRPALPPLLVAALAAVLMGPAPSPAAETEMDVLLPPPSITVRNAPELRQAWRRAMPGQVIRLRPGNYRLNTPLANKRGQPGQPITLAALDPSNPPVFRPTRGDALKLSRVAHIQLQDLVIAGSAENGLNIDDGGRFDEPSTHITLRRLRCSTSLGGGNRDAIKLSGIHHLMITDCTITDWADGGTGIDIVRCKEVTLTYSSIQTKPGRGHTGVQVKGTSENVRLVRNRFEHAGERAVQIGGATGATLVPGGVIPFEARDVLVAGNTFIGSSAPVAFVSSDGGRFAYNTVINPGRWLVRILQENRSPDCVPANSGVIERNLVVFNTQTLRQPVNIGPGTQPRTFHFAENFWYATDAPGRSRPSLPTDEADGVYGQGPQLPDDPTAAPPEGSPAHGYGAHAWPGE